MRLVTLSCKELYHELVEVSAHEIPDAEKPSMGTRFGTFVTVLVV